MFLQQTQRQFLIPLQPKHHLAGENDTVFDVSSSFLYTAILVHSMFWDFNAHCE